MAEMLWGTCAVSAVYIAVFYIKSIIALFCATYPSFIVVR